MKVTEALGGTQTGRENKMTPKWIVDQVVKAESRDHTQSTDVWPYDGVSGEKRTKNTLSHKREREKERRKSLHLLDEVGRGPREITQNESLHQEVERGTRG